MTHPNMESPPSGEQLIKGSIWEVIDDGPGRNSYAGCIVRITGPGQPCAATAYWRVPVRVIDRGDCKKPEVLGTALHFYGKALAWPTFDCEQGTVQFVLDTNAEKHQAMAGMEHLGMAYSWRQLAQWLREGRLVVTDLGQSDTTLRVLTSAGELRAAHGSLINPGRFGTKRVDMSHAAAQEQLTTEEQDDLTKCVPNAVYTDLGDVQCLVQQVTTNAALGQSLVRFANRQTRWVETARLKPKTPTEMVKHQFPLGSTWRIWYHGVRRLAEVVGHSGIATDPPEVLVNMPGSLDPLGATDTQRAWVQVEYLQAAKAQPEPTPEPEVMEPTLQEGMQWGDVVGLARELFPAGKLHVDDHYLCIRHDLYSVAVVWSPVPEDDMPPWHAMATLLNGVLECDAATPVAALHGIHALVAATLQHSADELAAAPTSTKQTQQRADDAPVRHIGTGDMSGMGKGGSQ